jgi:hypothetical protein
MSMLAQFLDHATLAKLNETQIRTLNDQLEGQLVAELHSNQALKSSVERNLKAAAAAHLNP